VIPALIALFPSIGIGFLFYLVIKAMIEGDRRERAATAKWEKEHLSADRHQGVDHAPPAPPTD
jgi:hypothetical protein